MVFRLHIGIRSRAALLFLLSFCAVQVQAKDLTSRLGVGYRNTYSFELPAVAASYYPNPETGLIGALGIDTAESNSKFAVTGGLRRIIFKEDNMNFFMSGTLAFVSSEVNGSTNSGFEICGLVGDEFFLPGLENLGFNIEGGVGVVNLGKVRFRTVADHILRAGVFFYF